MRYLGFSWNGTGMLAANFLGEGRIDFQEVAIPKPHNGQDFQEGLDVLRKNNYKNFLTLECAVRSQAELVESMKYLRKII